MNQEKIGKFIAECRKEKNLTQEKLAEILGVSNRTISKWENGKCMPDYSIIIALCNTLDISINELFCGEKLENSNYQKKLEENIIINMDLLKKKTKKIIKRILTVFTCIIILIVLSIIVFLSYMSISQSKVKVDNDKIEYSFCKFKDKYLSFTIKSTDDNPILEDVKVDTGTIYYEIYRYKNSKFMEDMPTINKALLPEDINSIYINDKIVYEKGIPLEECE